MILGYQNQPVGTTPTHWVPALYVGTNGLLYAEIWNGAVQPIASATKVNDGQEHTAVFTLSGSTETLTLDGKLVGTLTGSPQPLDMTFDELGDGETGGWPGGNRRLRSLRRHAEQCRDLDVQHGGRGLHVPGGHRRNPEDHLAEPAEPMRRCRCRALASRIRSPGAGTETLSLLATNSLGGTAVTTSTSDLTDVPPTPTIDGLPASSPRGRRSP